MSESDIINKLILRSEKARRRMDRLEVQEIFNFGGMRDAAAYAHASSSKGFIEAITSFGGNDGVIYLSPANYTITANYTVPTNAHLIFAKGAYCTVSNAVTLTINGTIEAGLYQVFDCIGTGQVEGGSSRIDPIYPQWFGALADGVADDAPAIRQTVHFAWTSRNMNPAVAPAWYARAEIRFPAGVYLCKSTVTFYPFISYLGVASGTADSTAFGNYPDSRSTIIRAHTDIYDDDNNTYGVLVYAADGPMWIAKITFIGTAIITSNPSVGIQWAASPGSGRSHDWPERLIWHIHVSECNFMAFTRAWECYGVNEFYGYGARFEGNTVGIFWSGQNAYHRNEVYLYASHIWSHAYGFLFDDDANDDHMIRMIGGAFGAQVHATNMRHIWYSPADAPDVDLQLDGTRFIHLSEAGTYQLGLVGGYDNAAQRWVFNGCLFVGSIISLIRNFGTAACTGWEFNHCTFQDVTFEGIIANDGQIHGGVFDDSTILAVAASGWQIADVRFRNIAGTALTTADAGCYNWLLANNFFETTVGTPLSLFNDPIDRVWVVEGNKGITNSTYAISRGAALAAAATWANFITLSAGSYLVSINSGTGARHCQWSGIIHCYDVANLGVAELLDTGFGASFTVVVNGARQVSITNDGGVGQVDDVHFEAKLLKLFSGATS